MAETKFKHIVRIANVDIPGEKGVSISLTHMKGVGKNLAHILCTLAGIPRQTKTGNLTDDQIKKLDAVVREPIKSGVPIWLTNRRRDFETGEDKHLLGGSLNFSKENDIKREKKIKTLRGVRHGRKLPVRGQRTKSNFRRSKGKVVGVKKKK